MNNPDFQPTHEVCMKSELPQAKIGKFNEETSTGDLKLISFDKEPNHRHGADITHTNTSYIKTCSGDSGSGHFMRNSDERKWALVAINSYARQHCGADAHAITTVHPDVLNWIKYHSKIVNYYESEVV